MGHGRTVRRRGISAMAGVLLAGSLALAACGSDDVDDDAAATTTALTGSTSATAPSGAVDPSAPASGAPVAPGDPSAPAPADPGGQDNPDPAAPPAPGDGDAPAGPDAPVDPAAPDPGAVPAGGEDAQQITDLIKGLNGDIPVADFMQYTIDHSCTAYLDARGGREVQQKQIDAIRENAGGATQGAMANNVTDVTDITVTGDSATATASGTIQGEEASEPVQLQRENGAWTLCPAA